jgi:hypothetical protein
MLAVFCIGEFSVLCSKLCVVLEFFGECSNSGKNRARKNKKNRVVFISMSNLTLKLVAAGASVYLSGEALLASLTYDEK